MTQRPKFGEKTAMFQAAATFHEPNYLLICGNFLVEFLAFLKNVYIWTHTVATLRKKSHCRSAML